jgi:hypothetical protein
VSNGSAPTRTAVVGASIGALILGTGAALAVSAAEDKADTTETVTTAATAAGTTASSPASTTPTSGTTPAGATTTTDDEAEKADVALIGATGEQTILLGPRRNNGQRFGTLTLLLSNQTDKERGLSVRYIRKGGPSSVEVGRAETSPVSILRSTPSSVAPNQPIELVLRFTTEATQAPEALDGWLVISLGRVKGAKPSDTAPLVVPVAGALDAVEGVSPEPSSVTMQITEWIPVANCCAVGDTASVRLVGPDAVALSIRQPNYRSTVLLRNDDGRSLVVELSDLEPHAGYVDAQVKTVSELGAGEYKGNLSLGTNPDDPKLALTVRSRHAVLYVVLAVLVGALLGLALNLVTGIRRRKSLLRIQVKAALEAYRDADKSHGGDLWDISDVIRKRDDDDQDDWYVQTDWYAFPRREGARGLWSAIHWARTSEDLDVLTAWANDFSLRIELWLDLLKPVADLEHEVIHPPLIDGKLATLGRGPWEDTGTYEDSLKLLDEVRRGAPKDLDEKAAEKLKLRVRTQSVWHAQVRELWEELARLRAAGKISADQLRRLRNQKLDLVTDPEVREKTRGADNWLDLLEAVREVEEEIAKRKTSEERRREAVGVDLSTAWIMHERSRNAAAPPDPSEGYKINQGGGDRKLKAGEMLTAVRRGDVFTTALLVLLASVVYAETLYDTTWGSPADYATAFLAGFTTKVIADWTVLPLFQSLRSSAKPPDTPQPKPKPPAAGAPTANGVEGEEEKTEG